MSRESESGTKEPQNLSARYRQQNITRSNSPNKGPIFPNSSSSKDLLPHTNKKQALPNLN